MKAWHDLETNPHVSIYRTRLSEWYIDMGIKIEKFDEDGRIEIKNTMSPNEKFYDISDEDRQIFEEQGWLAGCLHVNIGTLERKIEWQEHLISTNCLAGPDTMHKKLEKNREKLLHYQQRLVKFVTP
jgi:hypothetical protein